MKGTVKIKTLKKALRKNGFKCIHQSHGSHTRVVDKAGKTVWRLHRKEIPWMWVRDFCNDVSIPYSDMGIQ